MDIYLWVKSAHIIFVIALMAGLLIEVVNVRSFGWTIHMEISGLSLIGTASLALVASLLAGVYPAWRITRTEPADALRAE